MMPLYYPNLSPTYDNKTKVISIVAVVIILLKYHYLYFFFFEWNLTVNCMSSGKVVGHFSVKPLRCLSELQTLIFAKLPSIIYIECRGSFIFRLVHSLAPSFYFRALS